MDRNEENEGAEDTRAVMVLPPDPVRRGCFAVLVPGNMKFEVVSLAGGFRLDFRPMTPHEHLASKRERGEL
ncbi:MAG: hypothetical protein IPK80_07315 [Nannocystis sp.]|nr:hypothetical protein [Nannocystis sp.]